MRTSKNWTARKDSAKPRGEEDVRREQTREEEYLMICSRLEVVGDPYDTMNLADKKIHAISLYYQLVKVSYNFSFIQIESKYILGSFGEWWSVIWL